MLSMYRVVSCVVGRWCLLWLVCSLGKTLLAFIPLRFVLQSQTSLLLQVPLDFLLLYSNPLWSKEHLFLLLVLEYRVGLHRTDQLQLLWHSQLGHRFGLMWCWMVCLGNTVLHRLEIPVQLLDWGQTSVALSEQQLQIPLVFIQTLMMRVMLLRSRDKLRM